MSLKPEGPLVFPRATQVVPEIESLRLYGPRDEMWLQLLQQLACGGWRDLVLDNDVWLEALAVLRGEIVGKCLCQVRMETLKLGRGEAVGDSFAEGADAHNLQREGRLRSREACEDLIDAVCVRKCVEECDVRGDVIALRREVALSQPIEVRLRGWIQTNG